MLCKIHNTKMIQLFTSWACDLCDNLEEIQTHALDFISKTYPDITPVYTVNNLPKKGAYITCLFNCESDMSTIKATLRDAVAQISQPTHVIAGNIKDDRVAVIFCRAKS